MLTIQIEFHPKCLASTTDIYPRILSFRVLLNNHHQIFESFEYQVYTKEKKFEAYISNIHHTNEHHDISKIG